MSSYLVCFAAVFAVNVLPAFGPPTWAVLVAFKLSRDLDPVPLVLGGAVCAASGRLLLATGARRFRGRFSDERLASLQAAHAALEDGGRRSFGALALFALSPVPSAQLFVAAGLLNLRLVPLTLAFFSGRLVSYSIYVGGASLANRAFGDVLTQAFTSPWGIALQFVMLGGLVLLVRVDWAKVLDRGKATAPDAKP